MGREFESIGGRDVECKEAEGDSVGNYGERGWGGTKNVMERNVMRKFSLTRYLKQKWPLV